MSCWPGWYWITSRSSSAVDTIEASSNPGAASVTAGVTTSNHSSSSSRWRARGGLWPGRQRYHQAVVRATATAATTTGTRHSRRLRHGRFTDDQRLFRAAAAPHRSILGGRGGRLHVRARASQGHRHGVVVGFVSGDGTATEWTGAASAVQPRDAVSCDGASSPACACSTRETATSSSSRRLFTADAETRPSTYTCPCKSLTNYRVSQQFPAKFDPL